ncbi:IreB family regulatory phosphoprotein [bacterium BFN5]|nr:IreB family regulatory phosphoprotein [bacterium BFN5]QJW48212.1 IreB family regulatory phosphoprotein [bacterium BFN5]
MPNLEETMMFRVENEDTNDAAVIIGKVCQSLRDKGYNPINQLVGYLLSGDPTYITSHNNARGLIRKLERDELLEELVRAYLKNK